jgi:serine/threonine protein kinase
MSQCFNPLCDRKNLSDAKFCQYCGSQLLLGDRFRALKILGQGSFGKTFLAVDESHLDKHRYAVKQFLPLAFTNREKASEMFEQEAKRLETLGQHPQIPTFIGYHEQEDRQYLVQEFIDGNNLLVELAEQGTFTEAKVFRLLNNLLPVLEFIHQHRVIHRDIKPENIIRRRLFLDPFIASSSKVEFVLVDFGAAKHATGSALVKTGTSIGSAEYVAPEQVRGKAEFASDIYSLGVTCIHLLTNTSPFNMIDGDNNWVWRDWLKDNPVSDRLTYILNKMISPQLSQRYAAVALVTADLRNSSLLKSPKKPLDDSLEEVAISTPVPPPVTEKVEIKSVSKAAMTWTVLNMVTLNDKIYALFGSDASTNPYRGDTDTNAVLPLLCIKKMGLPTPAGLSSPTRTNGGAMVGTWSGGKVIVVPDVQGNSLISKEIADRQCQLQGLKVLGEDGFRMAEFHDGDREAGGAAWNFWADASAIEMLKISDQRYWVSINDQPANPWK